MTKKEYLDFATEHAPALRYLLGNYHPASAEHARNWSPMNITAPAAQAACDIAVEQIKREEDHKAHPVARFDAALKAGEDGEIGSLLQSAWFGVPESTECWSISGFREAVHLLENPVEGDEE